MIYEYACARCTGVVEVVGGPDHPDKELHDTGTVQCVCGGLFKRRFSFAVAPVFESFYDHASKREVHSERGYQDNLKRRSDAATARNGIPHEFRATDVREIRAHPDEHGITDAGMKQTHDLAVARGEKPPTGRVVL